MSYSKNVLRLRQAIKLSNDLLCASVMCSYDDFFCEDCPCYDKSTDSCLAPEMSEKYSMIFDGDVKDKRYRFTHEL